MTRIGAAAVPDTRHTASSRLRWAGIRPDAGLLAALLSAATFASSGPFAKSLLAAGWTPGSVVTARVGIAGLVLLGPALYAVRHRLLVLRESAGLVVAFGLVAVAGCQVAYFNAVQRMPIGVALLLEYLGVVLVVLWVSVRTRRVPTRSTVLGVVACLGGLALVLDLSGGGGLDPVGVLWGLIAAIGLAVYFVVSAHGGTGLPPVALAGFGMLVGAAALGIFGWVGVLPVGVAATPVTLGDASLPWWVAVAELALVAAAAAYLLGAIGARRLGSTVASFVGLTEVLFAVGLAWLLLGEVPSGIQAAGGALILAGVVAVRVGELRAGS
ncbi:MAG: DMT family transporter [Candidatus Phosphoribacter sp.]